MVSKHVHSCEERMLKALCCWVGSALPPPVRLLEQARLPIYQESTERERETLNAIGYQSGEQKSMLFNWPYIII